MDKNMRPLLLLLVGLGAAHPCAYGQSSNTTRKPEVKMHVPVKVTEEALRIHRDAILIDGHNDLPWQFREKKDLSFTHIDIARRQKALHTDIPRLREGGVGAQFWSAF